MNHTPQKRAAFDAAKRQAKATGKPAPVPFVLVRLPKKKEPKQ